MEILLLCRYSRYERTSDFPDPESLPIHEFPTINLIFSCQLKSRIKKNNENVKVNRKVNLKS